MSKTYESYAVWGKSKTGVGGFLYDQMDGFSEDDWLWAISTYLSAASLWPAEADAAAIIGLVANHPEWFELLDVTTLKVIKVTATVESEP